MKSENKHIAAFIDLDGTLYDGYIWLALRRYYMIYKFKLPILFKYLILHLPLWPLMKIGIVSSEFVYHAWGANMAWLVQGITIERANEIWEWIVENEILPKIRPEMRAVIHDHRKKCHHVVLLSGTFQPLLDHIALRLGIREAIATPLLHYKGRYTGNIEPPLNIGEGKVKRLIDYIYRPGNNIDLRSSYVYTDSIVDLPVLELFGYPIVVYPDNQLAVIAQQRGWSSIGSN